MSRGVRRSLNPEAVLDEMRRKFIAGGLIAAASCSCGPVAHRR